MRKQKIISLTDDLYNEASKMENFSKWVRDRLEEHIQRTKTDDGRTMTYVCMKCCEDDGVEFQKGPTKDRRSPMPSIDLLMYTPRRPLLKLQHMLPSMRSMTLLNSSSVWRIWVSRPCSRITALFVANLDATLAPANQPQMGAVHFIGR